MSRGIRLKRLAPRGATARRTQSEPVIRSHTSVLVVEDDPAIRRLLEALLTSAGYQVYVAADGPEAFALVAAQRFDGVFLDVSLPGLSGWEVLSRLRAAPDAPPVVVLSGDPNAVRRARTSGAADAILKPFDIDELLNAAERLLGPPAE